MPAAIHSLGCEIKPFPCTYLGMPLSDSKLRKVDYQPALDKLCSKLKGWIRIHFSMDGRILLVKHVLSAMVVFQMMVIEMPAWLRKRIDGLRRGVLWEGKEFAVGGKCLVSWRIICRPIKFGGLGMTDLSAQSTALRMRWLWLSWTDPSKAWLGLSLSTDARVRMLFVASVNFHLGDGQRICFWTEPWMQGMSFCHRFPALFGVCTRKRLMVAQALIGGRWTRHLRGSLMPQTVREFTALWMLLQDVTLVQQ